MEFRKVTAVIPREALRGVEKALRDFGVPAVTVTPAKGYGEYKNFFSPDWKVATARIEIFTTRAEAEAIAQAIMNGAHSEIEGSGLVAILPVEQLYHIRTRSPATDDEICCRRERSAPESAK